MQQCCGTVLVEQWNSESGTLWWNSGAVMVEQCWWNSDGRTVRWNSGTVLVEQWNSDGGTVEQCWWNSVTVEQ